MHRLLPFAILLLATTACAGPAPRRLDHVLERATAWSPQTSDHLTVRLAEGVGHGTPRSLLIEWNKELGAFEGGIYRAPQLPSTWIRLPDDLDLSRYTRLTLHARIGGARHGFLHVVVSNKPAIWGTDVVSLTAHAPLEAGDWQQAVLSLDIKPLADRKQMRWLGLASANVGHHPDESGRLRTWIDDVVLSADEPPKRSGWDADPSMVHVSRLGFRPFHRKIAVVAAERAGQRFELRRTDTRAVAFRGTLALVESRVGRHAVADFSELAEPGAYRVHVGDLSSLPFRIGEEAHEHSLGLLTAWVQDMRCGRETGLHPACHLDDGVRIVAADEPGGPARLSLPVSGGWHDAGDVRTYFSYSYEMGYRLLRARDAGRRSDLDRDGADDLQDGARWALQHAVKLADPVTGRLFDKIDDRGDGRRGNHWTDNLRGTEDDRALLLGDEHPRHVAALAASAGLAMRRADSEADRRLAAQAVALAERRLDAWLERPAPLPGRPARAPRLKVEQPNALDHARFGLGGLQLYLATEREEHLALARASADALMRLQAPRLFPGALEELGGDILPWSAPHEGLDLPELFLAELLIELPDDPDAGRWRVALRRVADHWMKPIRGFWGPYSVPPIVVSDVELGASPAAIPLAEPQGKFGRRWILAASGRMQLADTALAMQRIAQALDDPEMERLARDQVHWAFGHNPLGVAWVVRHDSRSIEQPYSATQGPMPGSVAGYGMGRDGVPGSFRPGGAEPMAHAGAELLAAAIAVTEPELLSLRITDGIVPWRGEAVVTWERTGREVARARTDSRGQLPTLALDGGERYRLTLGEVELPLVAISGRQVHRHVDREEQLLLTATVNEPAAAMRPFTVALRVENVGTARVTDRLSVHVEGARSIDEDQTLELGPGEVLEIDWPLAARGGNSLWVATFRTAETGQVADATGVVFKPTPEQTR